MIRNVIEYLEKTAERYPNKVAVIDENRQKKPLRLQRGFTVFVGSCIMSRLPCT